MANIKFSQFTPSGGGYTPARATTFMVGYDNSGGPDNVRLTISDLETSLINWPDYSIATNYVAVVNNPIVQLDKTTSYGAASSFVQFVGKNGSLVTSDATDRVNIDSGEYSYGVNGTDTLRLTKVGGTAAGPYDIQVVGSGITVSSTGGTNLTLTNAGVTSLAATTPINVSGATGAVTISSDAYTGGTGIGYVPTGGSATTFLRGDATWVTPTDTNTTYTLTAPNANTIRLQDSGGANNDISVSAGAGIGLTQAAPNNILITNTGSFTTQSTTGTISISGSPTSTGGTLNVDQASGIVTPGTYNTANVTVDTYGRVTNIATGNIGVSQIIAGTNVTISPAGGTGAVTVNASGGGGAVNGTILKTNIYYNDSTNPAAWASYSLPSSTTMGQVQFTPSTSGIVQNVGISFVRLAEFDAYRIQLTMSVQNQQDPDIIHMGLHYDPLAVTGANCWYGWQNPGILDSDGSIRNIALTCYWDILARDLRYVPEEEPVEVPVGGTAPIYLKGAASGTGTEIQFATNGTRGINGGWNNGNGIPSTTNNSGMPLIMTVYGINTSIRATNPGGIP